MRYAEENVVRVHRIETVWLLPDRVSEAKDRRARHRRPATDVQHRLPRSRPNTGKSHFQVLRFDYVLNHGSHRVA